MNVNDIEITDSMIDAVVSAQLYREDVIDNLRKAGIPKITNIEVQALYKRIVESPDFNEKKKNAINLQKMSLVEDDVDTMMLFYNKLLKDAQREGKYEVAARILKEIRELKAIENEQMRFEIIITVKKPEDTNKNA